MTSFVAQAWLLDVPRFEALFWVAVFFFLGAQLVRDRLRRKTGLTPIIHIVDGKYSILDNDGISAQRARLTETELWSLQCVELTIMATQVLMYGPLLSWQGRFSSGSMY